MLLAQWRDLLSISGWLLGALSFIWGVRQSARAETAEVAVRRTRKALHRRRGIQQLLSLSEATMTLQSEIEVVNRISIRKAAVIVAADLTRATSFFASTLPAGEAGRLILARESLSNALSVVALQGKEELRDIEKRQIQKLCLEAALELQALRGFLEMTDELDEN